MTHLDAPRQARRDWRDSESVTPSSLDEVLAGVVMRREFLYGCTKRISGTNRLSELKPPIAKSSGNSTVAYRIDPCTRYCHLPPGIDWDGSMKVLVAEMGDMEEAQQEMESRLRAAEQVQAATGRFHGGDARYTRHTRYILMPSSTNDTVIIVASVVTPVVTSVVTPVGTPVTTDRPSSKT